MMSGHHHIPIVQGVAVSDSDNKYHQQPPPYQNPDYNNIDNFGNDGGGDIQIVTEDERRALRQHPRQQYNDVGFAIAFWAHVVLMIGLICYNLTNNYSSQLSGAAVKPVLMVVGVCGLVAVGISAFSLQWMMNNARVLVQYSLIFSVVFSLGIAVLGFVVNDMLMGILGLVSFAIGICYAYFVWRRIPFAAANLSTALSAIRVNLGTTAVALGLTVVAFGWSVLWFLGLGDALQGDKTPIVFLLFVSYYWVHEVLRNTIHVTVAGVVGTWWFVPEEASSWWSPALSSSLFRASTYSFGSICFGSLLVAVVRALRSLEQYARSNDDMTALICIIQCILACIESIIEYFNRWAFIYCGLYGMDYITAGKNVMHLFESRGWTAIITDDLADNVLFMVSIGVGLVSGLVGFMLGSMDGDMFSTMQFDNAAEPAFVVGFLSGFTFATVFFAVVGSAVNTVIVCYAEAPAEFQINHPALSAEMRNAWTEAWSSDGVMT